MTHTNIGSMKYIYNNITSIFIDRIYFLNIISCHQLILFYILSHPGIYLCIHNSHIPTHAYFNINLRSMYG